MPAFWFSCILVGACTFVVLIAAMFEPAVVMEEPRRARLYHVSHGNRAPTCEQGQYTEKVALLCFYVLAAGCPRVAGRHIDEQLADLTHALELRSVLAILIVTEADGTMFAHSAAQHICYTGVRTLSLAADHCTCRYI